MTTASRRGVRAGRFATVLGAVFANRRLRRLELAFAGFNAAEWGVWIAMLVYAFDHGGATAAGLVALAQLAPAALFAPLAATLADRRPPARVLTLGYVAQAGAMGATAVALLASAPPLLAYGLAATAASAVTITRPAQAALVPSIVRGIDELTATNVVSSWIESVSVLTAPAVAGALLAVSGPGAVFAVMAGVALLSAMLVAPLEGPPGAASSDSSGGRSIAQLGAGFEIVAREPAARLLVAVLGAQFVLIGALDVLFVVLAVDVLGLGGSGAGYLNATFGAGGVLGVGATAGLVGRARLAPPLTVAALGWALALLLLGLWPTVLGAFSLLAAAGATRSVLDVAARTLLQRTARGDLLGRVFGLLEALDAVGLAVGSVLAPLLVAALGPEAAIAGLAPIIPALLLLSVRRLREADERADVPVVEVALLRSLPIFSSLDAPVLESVARSLQAVDLRPGERVIREGDPGERYYVVADGALEVTQASVPIRTVERGAGVGEISLLARVPCTATVTASTAARLYALDGERFLELLSTHPESARVARRVVRERLRDDGGHALARSSGGPDY